MTSGLLVLVGICVLMVVGLQVRFYRKLKEQTKMLVLQSQEIKKQMNEMQAQNQLLAQLNSEKQQIIGVVSHDLKGPFNRIFALIQLMNLTSENFTDEQRDYIGKIHQIVADGLGMVRNLLDNRKLEDKGIELIMETVNATSLLSASVKNYRILADKKKIKIHLEPKQSVMLRADKTYFTRIIDNLLSNAIKFSPPEQNIFVSMLVTPTAVQVKVKDQGPGINQDDQKKLFQKYQRLTPRPTGGESSTGLGLYLIKAMVSKMEGEVFCESVEGGGAEFTVSLKISGELNHATQVPSVS